MDNEKRITIVIDTILNNQKSLDALRGKLNNISSFYESNAKKLKISTEEFKKNWQSQGLVFEKVSDSVINKAKKQIEVESANKEKQSNIQQKVAEAAMRLANKNKFLNTWSEKLGVNTSRITQAMSSAGLTFDKTGRVVDLAGRKVKNLDGIMKMAEIKTRRFNMSLLSTMFAGMALQRSMTNLLRPAAESSGIFDIFSDILITTFSPIMEAIAPILEKFSDIMDRLSDSTRMIIGIIAVVILGFGVLLAVGSQLGLAWGGLSVQMGTLIVLLQGVSASMGTLATTTAIAGTAGQVALAPILPILLAISAVILLVIGIWYYWEDIVDGFSNALESFNATVRMVVTSVVLFFGWLSDSMESNAEIQKQSNQDLSDFISGIWNGIGDWIAEKWAWITSLFTWENIQTVLTAIWTFFVNIWNVIWGVVVTVWNAIWGFLGPILSAIWGFIVIVFTAIWTTITTILSLIWAGIVIVWNAIWTTITTVLTAIWTTITTIFTSIWDFLKGVWDGIVGVFNWAWDVLKDVGKGIANVFILLNNIVIGVWNGIISLIQSGINSVINGINSLIRLLNMIPGVHIGKIGSVSLQWAKLPTMPYLAEGGIIRKPTMAMVGESGPEAVVPLGKGFGSTINFSPVYNITVSDKYEFERMIKFNNTKLVEDLRRTVEG